MVVSPLPPPPSSSSAPLATGGTRSRSASQQLVARDGLDSDPVVQAALQEAARLLQERDERLRRHPRPAMPAAVSALTNSFHTVLADAKRRGGVGSALRDGVWIDEAQPLLQVTRDAARAALEDGAYFLESKSRSDGTNVNRDRHLRNWFLFCRLLGYRPFMYDRSDVAALHAFVAWRSLGYVRKGDIGKAGVLPGLQHGSVANEVSAIRTYHASFGVDLLEIDPRSSQLVKGLRRISGSVKPALRISEAMMDGMRRLDLASGTELDRAHVTARDLCYTAMFRISEVAATAKAKHYLLHADVSFSMLRADGSPQRCTWVLRSSKARQFLGETRSCLVGQFVDSMWSQWQRNEAFLAERPGARQSLPFVQVRGRPLSKAQVQRRLRARITQLSAGGAVDVPALYRAGTHCLRRGGARMWNALLVGDVFIKWLGRWRSLAWLRYPDVSERLLLGASARRDAFLEERRSS